jgi:energy-converting hydrogenase Eha subunit F
MENPPPARKRVGVNLALDTLGRVAIYRARHKEDETMDRVKWVHVALVAFLLSGCAISPRADAPPKPAPDPAPESAVKSRNVFAPYMDNKLNSWTVSPRIDMPIGEHNR